MESTMEDKENNDPKITQKYQTIKLKLNAAEEENKRLRKELAESNAKVESIQNTKFLKELTETTKNPTTPIQDVLRGTAAPVLHEKAPENPIGLAIFQGRTNPLEVDVVLHKVFNYLSGKDLGTCRLVNSIWKSNATCRFKKTHRQIFLRNCRTTAEFAQGMLDTTQFPYSSFLIKDEFRPRFATQFERFGGHVKVLKLRVKDFGLLNRMPRGHEMTLSNIMNIFSFTPNLERLELSGFGFVNGSIQAEGIDQFEIPSLKHIRLETDYLGFLDVQAAGAQENAQAVSSSLRRIFSTASELTSLKVCGGRLHSILLPLVAPLNTLQTLEFDHGLSESHLECLARGFLRLTSLKVSVELFNGQRLEEFLTSQAGTLRSLMLHASRSNPIRIQPVTFPVFPNLKYLNLSHTNKKAFFQRRPNGNEFPVLQNLWVTSELLSRYFLVPLPISAVKFLHYDCEFRKQYGTSTHADLPGVQESFPNVKKIHVKSPTKQAIKSIFNKTANFLEHLVMEFSNSNDTHIDAMLTGAPSSSWLTELVQRLNEAPVLIRRIVTNFYVDIPNIGIHGMKKLKTLEIRCNDDARYKLTDVSGYISLLSMHPLEYLAIYNSKLSETCIEELRKVHKTVVIKTLSKEEQIAYQLERYYPFGPFG